MTDDRIWTIVRGTVRLDLQLIDRSDGSVECVVMNGASEIATHLQPSRDLGRVCAEQLRQAYFADGWRDDDV